MARDRWAKKSAARKGLSAAEDYLSWKKSIMSWSEFTSVEPTKQGAAVFLTLDGTVCDAALDT